jgi:hypothetical protein
MKAILFALAAGLCWAVGELCTKSVLHGQRIGPVTAIAVRALRNKPVAFAVAPAVAALWGWLLTGTDTETRVSGTGPGVAPDTPMSNAGKVSPKPWFR